jgi:F-type H+-transporting ATPase subunit b
MNSIVTMMASTGESNLFTALGIDWKLLILQTVAFLVLLWFLAKFVFPPLTRMLEKRDETIAAGVKAANAAEKKAGEAQEEMAKLLKQARKEASDIVSTAKEEAVAVVEASDAKSKARAERLLADAHVQVEKDIAAAKRDLHNETLNLVALATEKVVGKTVTSKVDDAIIAAAVREAK